MRIIRLRSRIMPSRHIWQLWVLMGLLLAACQPGAVTPTDTPTPIPPTLPPTATINWFPITATATMLPTSTPLTTPTPVLLPEPGALILSDDFSPSTAWSTTRNEIGSIAFGNNELTLAVTQRRSRLYTLRTAPRLDDFYLEITSTASLCRAGDTYGLLLRAAGAQDFYRLLIGCDGRVRFERVIRGTASPLQDWQFSGQVPPGAPLSLRLGVWAEGSILRVFINNEMQFEVSDSIWTSGQLGLFAASAGNVPLSVSFSDLKIYHAAGLTPLPTVTPSPSPASTR